MRTAVLGLAAVAALSGGVRAADGEAVAVIEKAIKAHGGAEKLRKFTGATVKMKGELEVLGTPTEVTGELAYAIPGKLRLALDLEVMGQKVALVQTVNGEKTRQTVNGNAVPLPDEAAAELRRAAVMPEVSHLVYLLDAEKYTLKADGTDEVNGKKAAVVVVSGPRTDGRDRRLWFDAESGLLVKIKRTTVGPSGTGTVEEERVMSEFKEFDGIKMATKVVATHDGKEYLKAETTEVEFADKPDEAKFMIGD
jgi:outer membrane lipoprotein-sorting protein